MRLIAVPLARVRPGAPPVSTFLAHSTRAAKPALPTTTSSSSSSSTSTSTKVTPNSVEKGKQPQRGDAAAAAQKEGDGGESEKKLPLATRLMNKASDFWIGLGKEGQKSPLDWKRRTYNLGESMMDRIEYEEWALKGVDPTVGPSLNPVKQAEKRSEQNQMMAKSKETKDVLEADKTPVAALNVPLLFPASLLSSSGLLSSLKRMTEARQPHHRQRLIWCVVGMPLTIPFILIPVIPNLPFFYLVWRAWSHWRAFSSSKYLSELIRQGRLVPTPSEELDRILALPSTETPKTDVGGKTEVGKDQSAASEQGVKVVDYEPFLLLKPHMIKEMVKSFKLEHQLSIELTRARQQTIKSIQRGQMDKLDEAAAREPPQSDKPQL